MSTVPQTAKKQPLRALIPVVFLGLMLYVDWITHREVRFIVIAGSVTMIGLIASRIVLARQTFTGNLATWGPRLVPIAYALPGVMYLNSGRGRGTLPASVASSVARTTFVLVAIVSLLGPWIDVRLDAFYATRDRILPLLIRILLAPVAAVLISFLVVHGSLADLPAMWGGQTESAKAAPEVPGSTYRNAAILSAGVSFLLLRGRKR